MINKGRSAQPKLTEIIVMLRSQASAMNMAPLTAEALGRLSDAAGITLTRARVTPTGGQVLTLPQPLSLEETKAITAKIGMLSDVLWAGPVIPAVEGSVRAEGLSSGNAGSEALVDKIIVKLKDAQIQQAADRNEPLDLAILAHLSQTAGVSLTMIRPMSGGTKIHP